MSRTIPYRYYTRRIEHVGWAIAEIHPYEHHLATSARNLDTNVEWFRLGDYPDMTVASLAATSRARILNRAARRAADEYDQSKAAA